MRVAVSLVVLSILAATAAGCPAPEDCLDQEPEYGGGGTDEAWRTMVDAKARAEAGGDAATLTVPAADSNIAPGTAFEWQSPLKLSSSLPLPAPARWRAGGLERSVRDVVQGALALIVPAAHAHLPPVTSDIYLLDLVVPGRACNVQVLTTELTHTLGEDSWDALVASEGPITLEMTSAFLTEGRVTEGPFEAAAVSFQVE